ncbi:fumarylacetoacetate hydrolase family protein [Tessaracoccus oleiagri]|uniref:2-keto-4-pentenoate hydratase/2-oxohepta-3-ene-1,7-dioic acid hydratase (Catechol pathway) n=1 Tax=Tessaracoccus oleiagri TaxID=686624 RepID=A0A1G9L4L0_9ACTN|nr:fumarylacetoacetate hydrolase family protein [Tessaracoccus oleiagri]SDL56851.1 2-keto-4-pentenoate hydratase/2-oxohepta-3-ene-1,7-dioic acid hydratase (catechol pathway) [Tessaracoccus oleiagri]
MRIARFAKDGMEPTYGIIELAVDAGDHPDTIAALTADPLAGVPVNYTGERFDLDEVRLLAPVIPRSKAVCIGKNYADHAKEMGGEVPEQLLAFFKPNTSVIGPGEHVVRPAGVRELHYEGELAIVIGRFCKEVPAERVKDVIFGYTIANDVSAREWQRGDGQWWRAKGSDTFLPLGPWINTHLTIEEASQLGIQTHVGDELRQDGNTRDMVRGIVDLVVEITKSITLLPGDLILTGTPAGVGAVEDGDEVSISIDGLGTLTNKIISE